MAQVENFDRLQRKLKQLARQYSDSPNAARGESVIVGYTAGYAVYVHENLQARHDVGQAKFLEQPARELNNNGELANIVATAVKRKVKLQQALYLAGLRLQRESQKLVPIDTGNLKASAFTRKE